MNWLAGAVLLTMAAWSADVYAANCKKGIPCGGSCISRDKVCRINTPTPPPSSNAAPPVGASKKSTPQAAADYNDLVPATISCPPGRTLLPATNPPMCARQR